jgi:hypothetical protein
VSQPGKKQRVVVLGGGTVAGGVVRWPGRVKSRSWGGPIEFDVSFWASAGVPAMAKARRMAAARRRRRGDGIKSKTLPARAFTRDGGGESIVQRRDAAGAGWTAVLPVLWDGGFSECRIASPRASANCKKPFPAMPRRSELGRNIPVVRRLLWPYRDRTGIGAAIASPPAKLVMREAHIRRR